MNVFIKPEIADSYDAYYKTEVGKKVNAIEEQLIGAALEKVPTGKMLELGCGTGHWTQFFIEKGFELTATDISDAMLKFAQQKGLKAELLKADSENLPFENESFGVLASVTMMEFVSDREKVLKEIYRVLKPKGYLLLACLNADSQLGKNSANDPVFKNANFFTPGSLKDSLNRFGVPEINCGVHFSKSFELTDGTEEQKNNEAAFMVALVQKTL